MRSMSLAVALGALCACDPHGGPGQAPAEAADGARFRPEWRTVLPVSRARMVLAQCSRPAPDPAGVTGFWVPAEADLAAADSLLAARIESEGTKGHPVRAAPRASEYHRQYVGLRIGERRVIYANAFLHGTLVADTSSAWREYPVLACDGGLGYVGAEIDPEARAILSYHVNGPG